MISWGPRCANKDGYLFEYWKIRISSGNKSDLFVRWPMSCIPHIYQRSINAFCLPCQDEIKYNTGSTEKDTVFALPYNMSIYHWNFTWSLSVVTKAYLRDSMNFWIVCNFQQKSWNQLLTFKSSKSFNRKTIKTGYLHSKNTLKASTTFSGLRTWQLLKLDIERQLANATITLRTWRSSPVFLWHMTCTLYQLKFDHWRVSFWNSSATDCGRYLSDTPHASNMGLSQLWEEKDSNIKQRKR